MRTPFSLSGSLAVATLVLAGCSPGSGSSGNGGDNTIVLHLAESQKIPIPVSCRVHADPSLADTAVIDATMRNVAKKTIVGADLTVIDGSATSAFVRLDIPAGKNYALHRSLTLTSSPSARASCTVTMVQYADKTGWAYTPTPPPGQ